MARTDIKWGDGEPTITIDVKFDAAQMKRLLEGEWVKLEEVTAKTLHEVAAALSDPRQVEIDDLTWEQMRLRYQIAALERFVSRQQRDAAIAESYYEVSQHDTPARARERATRCS